MVRMRANEKPQKDRDGEKWKRMTQNNFFIIKAFISEVTAEFYLYLVLIDLLNLF